MQIKKNFNNESGYTLMAVLAIFSVVAILGTSLATLTLGTFKNSVKEKDNQSAYYISEAALREYLPNVEKEIELIKSKNLSSQQFFSEVESKVFSKEIKYDNFEKVKSIQPYAEVKAEKISSGLDKRKYELISTGYIGDESRVVFVPIEISYDFEKIEVDIGEFALLTKSGMKMTGGATIIGDVGTLGTGKEILEFPAGNNPTINGKLLAPVESVENAVSKGEYVLGIPEAQGMTPFPFPTLPTFPEVNKVNTSDQITTSGGSGRSVELKGDVYLDSINIHSNTTLELVVNEEVNLHLNHLNVETGHITIKGDGVLNVYLHDKLTTRVGSFNRSNTGDEFQKLDQLNIFYKGKDDIVIKQDFKLYGSLYAETANVYIGGGSRIYGNILTGGSEVSLDGGTGVTSQIIFAPNAEFNLAAGTNFKGMIFTDHFNTSGGSVVEYAVPDFGDGPLNLESILEEWYSEIEDLSIEVFDYKINDIREK